MGSKRQVCVLLGFSLFLSMAPAQTTEGTVSGTFQIGATAQNITKSPQFAAPNTAISSASFGRITSTASTYRILVLQSRLNF